MENKSNKPISILLLGTQMAVGGAQKVLLDQAGWFHKQGHKVLAAFIYDKENLQPKWQAASKFQIINLKSFQNGWGGIVNGLLIVKGLFSLWRLLRREKIDVIETFTHDSSIFALPVAWLAGVPVRIATHHGVIENFPPWREKIHAWLVNHGAAQALVAVSSRIRKQALLEGVDANRVTVIKNGIAPLSLEGVNRPRLRKEAGLKDEDLFGVSVGRLVYQKAHNVLIQAMPSILKKYPNFKIGICGNGALRSDLESQILRLDLCDSIKLLGIRDDVNGVLSAADVFVLPSRWEGLPIALLEAMSVGLPIVATKVEGVDEVVKDGEHGFLIPVENSEALADAILQLLGDRQLRQKMGAAAKSHVLKQYTEDSMCEQYFQLMTKFLSLQ